MRDQLREAAMLMRKAEDDDIDRAALLRMFPDWPNIKGTTFVSKQQQDERSFIRNGTLSKSA